LLPPPPPRRRWPGCWLAHLGGVRDDALCGWLSLSAPTTRLKEYSGADVCIDLSYENQ